MTTDSKASDVEAREREPMRRDAHGAQHGMNLPEGATCADCVHCRRCCLIFGHIPQDEQCDWSPSRFRPAPDTERTE